MFGRTGQEVLVSARQALPPLQMPSPVHNSQLSPGSQRFNTPHGAIELPARRKAAVKQAFKRLDRHGRGSVALEDALQMLSGSAGLGSMAIQELRLGLGALADPGADGKPMLSFAAFCAYYQGVSPGYAHDGDFEQLLEAQWGCTDVSDILAAMQRQFARVGLMHAFQDRVRGSVLTDIGADEFRACLRRAGVQARSDDLQRLFSAFAAPGGGLRLQDFKEQIVAPRPETPMQTRELVTSAAAGPPPAAAALEASRLPPGGRPGTAPGHPLALTALPAAAVPAAGRPPQTVPGVPPPGRATAVAAGQQQEGRPPTDQDLDKMLERMESQLHHLKKKSAGPTAAAGMAASAPVTGRPGKAGTQAATQKPHPELDGPITDSDLDATLSRMEAHIHDIKAHKSHKAPAQPEPAPPPVDMPHWEHHKYGHHEIKAPEWKPQDKVTDIYGHQHASSEYHYSNFGAGAHGHHLAHYHLNDYGGLAHHSFQQQEFNRKQYGTGSHSHWVPHLHGLGTQSHHGEHEYKPEEYEKETFGKEGGAHSHWVPHLHGLGEQKPKPGGTA